MRCPAHTTDASAPVPRIGTQILTATDRLDFSLGIGTTGSCVPYRSLSQGHAAFMPDAGWAVGMHLPTLARGIEDQSRFRRRYIRYDTSSAVHSRSSPQDAPDGITFRLFPQRSPQGLFTPAACGGLKPAPAGRPRGAVPHLR